MSRSMGDDENNSGGIIRAARVDDVPAILKLVSDLVEQRVLVPKENVSYYENIQEFLVLENAGGGVSACGAIHVMWDDLAEVRTVAVDAEARGRGLGGRLLQALCDKAHNLGVKRLFCLTFEVDFFAGHGFEVVDGPPQDTLITGAYKQLLLSTDEGVAEFLELARVRPNTLGNTRMIKHL